MGILRPDRFVTLYCVRPLQACGLARPSSGLPILMYHSISDDSESGVPPYYRLCTSPAQFRRQMHFLRDHGFRALALAEAVSLLNDGVLENKVVVITFDDGFRDFYTEAAPVLEECGFTATVYLPTAFIGNTRLTFRGRECLCWREVRELHQRGFHFGSHTVNHPVLYGLPSEQITVELRESRVRIEAEVQSKVTDFAYPYAFPQHDKAFTARFAELLDSTGYCSSVTTKIGRARRGESLLAMRRLPVNGGDDPEFLGAKLSGAYDWLYQVQAALKLLNVPLRAKLQNSPASGVSC